MRYRAADVDAAEKNAFCIFVPYHIILLMETGGVRHRRA